MHRQEKWVCGERFAAAPSPDVLLRRGVRTAPVSKLHDALLGLSRDDALRRAYLRRCWTQNPELGMRRAHVAPPISSITGGDINVLEIPCLGALSHANGLDLGRSAIDLHEVSLLNPT